jgi:hypothetical protein
MHPLAGPRSGPAIQLDYSTGIGRMQQALDDAELVEHFVDRVLIDIAAIVIFISR